MALSDLDLASNTGLQQDTKRDYSGYYTFESGAFAIESIRSSRFSIRKNRIAFGG